MVFLIYGMFVVFVFIFGIIIEIFEVRCNKRFIMYVIWKRNCYLRVLLFVVCFGICILYIKLLVDNLGLVECFCECCRESSSC